MNNLSIDTINEMLPKGLKAEVTGFNLVTISGKCIFYPDKYTHKVEDVKITDLSLYYLSSQLIQNVWPDMPPEDREFIKTGVSPEGWDEMFGCLEEEM